MDPDGGVNLAKKKQKLGAVNEVDPELNEKFPSSGFQCGISELPRIAFGHIWKYLIEDVELRKKLSTEKPIMKGYNFYKSGHVRQIFSKKEGDKCFVKSQVLPSMKKGKVYTVKAVLQSNGDIAKAVCGCPAGVDGRCNHLAATMFAIEDQWNIRAHCETSNGGTETPANVPCTSQPCAWNVPTKRKLNTEPIQCLKFQKHEWGRKSKHSPRDQNDVRAPHQRTMSDGDIKQFYDKVKEVEMKTGKKMGLSFILPHSLPEESDCCVNKSTDSEAECPVGTMHKWKLVSPYKVHPVSMEEIASKADRVKQRLFDSGKEREEVEKATRDQHNSMLWYSVRQPRITASKTKRCLMKETTSPTKAISEVLMYKPNIQTRLMKEGIEMEPKIIERFSKETGNIVNKCGFFISESHPFLGASPDGITERGNIIEVKKVTSKEEESMEDTLCRLGIYKKNGDQISINTKHKYYCQIQQQLFCSDVNTSSSHFIVSNGIWMHHEEVAFDNSFWKSAIELLGKFYFDNILPEIVYPRVLHGQSRWNKEIAFPGPLP